MTERLGVGVIGRRQYRGRRADLHQPASIHDGNAIRDVGDDGQVVA